MTPYNGEVLVVTAEEVGDRLEVTAMVPGVSESEGTCTLIVDGGDSASVRGAAGNEVTYCGVMAVPSASLAGTVQFRVSYESASTTAESAVSTIELTR